MTTDPEILSLEKSHRCAECGAGLLAPWVGTPGEYGKGHHELRCSKDPGHEGIVKYRATKKLTDGRIYDVQTQRPVDERQALAVPKDEPGMLDRVNQALNIGLFPDANKLTKPQLTNLAKLALLYGLDPLMREIIPYHGNPYITIDGRRRIDDRSGHHPSLKFRPLDNAERQSYQEMGAIDPNDICIVCVGTTEFGNTIEVMGRVKASERKGNDFLPTVSWSLEMARKRSEAQWRRVAYGPVALPGGMDSHLHMIEEGDIIEGEWKDVITMELRQPEETPAGDLLPSDEAAEPGENIPQDNPDVYKPLLEEAGQHGLDLEGFCSKVLAQPDIATFEKIGGTPAIALKRWTDWQKKNRG